MTDAGGDTCDGAAGLGVVGKLDIDAAGELAALDIAEERFAHDTGTVDALSFAGFDLDASGNGAVENLS